MVVLAMLMIVVCIVWFCAVPFVTRICYIRCFIYPIILIRLISTDRGKTIA